jgi:hypothetical protein
MLKEIIYNKVSFILSYEMKPFIYFNKVADNLAQLDKIRKNNFVNKN